MDRSVHSVSHPTSFPRHGWVGLALIAVAWPLNWGVGIEGLRTHLLFFPLWLGYALLVDATVKRRRGTSILTRSRLDFAGLFLASAPAWWLFEAVNAWTQNWTYVGDLALRLINDVFGVPLIGVRLVREGRLVPVRTSPEVDEHTPPRLPVPVEGESVLAEAYQKGTSSARRRARRRGPYWNSIKARVLYVTKISTCQARHHDFFRRLRFR